MERCDALRVLEVDVGPSLRKEDIEALGEAPVGRTVQGCTPVGGKQGICIVRTSINRTTLLIRTFTLLSI